ncbi:MAG: iron-containing redox enzyme family protein [Desertifilum sp. SIO1I2]|nr:iron-containing redox enzyme family protein [Desertifilum sp. SIO1I2]
MQQLEAQRMISPQTLGWQELVKYPTLNAAVLHVASSYDFRYHPYLVWMQETATSREAFCQSQLPFRFAVESFSQALAAVLARIPLLETRMTLFENIAEEHGRGDRKISHKATFQRYLQALGATAVELETPCTIPVLAFNASILSYCLTQPPEASAAMLGTIEYLYVGISSAIARTLLERNWTLPGSQSHYTTHEILDTQHAEDLLALAATSWDVSHSRILIAQALLLGAYYFWSLYDDLLPRL